MILDCRNSYESDVGAFKGAVPLGTTVFRDTWDALGRVLDGKPKDTPLLTYCTGGIRCVKVGAYLTQKLGYTNVGRLEGGIVNYTQNIRRVAETEDVPFANVSKFSGLNYVFNDRMAEFVTPDIPNPASADRRAVEAKAVVATVSVASARRRTARREKGAAARLPLLGGGRVDGARERRTRGVLRKAERPGAGPAGGGASHDRGDDAQRRPHGERPPAGPPARHARQPRGRSEGARDRDLHGLLGAVLRRGGRARDHPGGGSEGGERCQGLLREERLPGEAGVEGRRSAGDAGKMVREDGAGPFDVVFIDADKRKYGDTSTCCWTAA